MGWNKELKPVPFGGLQAMQPSRQAESSSKQHQRFCYYCLSFYLTMVRNDTLFE